MATASAVDLGPPATPSITWCIGNSGVLDRWSLVASKLVSWLRLGFSAAYREVNLGSDLFLEVAPSTIEHGVLNAVLLHQTINKIYKGQLHQFSSNVGHESTWDFTIVFKVLQDYVATLSMCASGV